MEQEKNCQSVEKNNIIEDSLKVNIDAESTSYGSEIDELITRANNGDIDAQMSLGWMFLDGDKVSADDKKAFQFFMMAAMQGHTKAQTLIAEFYHNGEVVKKDYCESFKWYQKASEAGNANADNWLGSYYEHGHGTIKNAGKALVYYEKAAMQGEEYGQFNLARCYENGIGTGKDIKKAIYWYKKSAEQGLGQSQFALGICYEAGIGVLKNYKKAFEWYTKAMESNFPAKYTLSFFYGNGKGIRKDYIKAYQLFEEAEEQDKDYKTAFNWILAAANKGDAWAKYKVGLCYLNGTGVEKDLYRAYKYFLYSAKSGEIEGQYYLGLCYSGGIGVEKDLAKAAEWYELAAKKEHPKALFQMARCYYYGYGVRYNEQLCYKYLINSIEKGCSEAENFMGLLYDRGDIVEKDKTKALDWFKAAAEKGLAVAQFNVGYAYHKGNDLEQALKWYEQALKNGYKQAQPYVKKCRLEIDKEKNNKNSVEGRKSTIVSGKQKLTEEQKLEGILRNDSSYIHKSLRKVLDNGLTISENIKQKEMYKYLDTTDDASIDKILEWMEKIASEGNRYVQIELLQSWWYSKSLKRRKCTATWQKQYFEKCNQQIEQGNIEGYCGLARCYLYGFGIEKNELYAIELYNKAIDNGSVQALGELAFCYDEGIGTVSDFQKAFALYEKAAHKKNADALFWLGQCYKDGKGVRRDIRKAFDYFKEASEQGNLRAHKCCDELIRSGKIHFNRAEVINSSIKKDIDLVIQCKDKFSNFLENDYLVEAALNMRHILEIVINYYTEKYTPQNIYDDTYNQINKLSDLGVFDEHITNVLHQLRILANKGAHRQEGQELSKAELQKALAPIEDVIEMFKKE